MVTPLSGCRHVCRCPCGFPPLLCYHSNIVQETGDMGFGGMLGGNFLAGCLSQTQIIAVASLFQSLAR